MTEEHQHFDAVEMMREIRRRISERISKMTLDQEQAWLESEKLGDPYLDRLREKAVLPSQTYKASRVADSTES